MKTPHKEQSDGAVDASRGGVRTGGDVRTWFAESCDRFRDRPAIICGGRSMSYGVLDDMAGRLASALISGGRRPGAIAAVCLEDRIEMIAALIACLRTGCVFVPLDGDSPPERLRRILEELRPECIISDNHWHDRLGKAFPAELAGAEIVVVDRHHEASRTVREEAEAETEGELEAVRPPVALDATEMCYIYYTSGSTGRPKGIAGTLKGLSHFIRWEIDKFDLDAGVRVSQLIIPTFDAFLRDVLAPLCCGGTVCIPPDRETVLDSRLLSDWIERDEINLIHCVPTVFAGLVRSVSPARRFPALRRILMAGEPLPVSDVRDWFAAFGTVIDLINLYGSTETTMVKFWHRVTESDLERGFIPIGQPMSGARALLLDENRRPCSRGAVGEIYIRSPYLTLGYYRQAQLTAEVFVPNPFNNDPKDLIYRTGDLGRMLDDGNFQFLGRKDHQVKIRGVRVELGEIEAALREHESIESAVVVDRADDAGRTMLVGYVVVREQNGFSLPALRTFLKTRLHESMSPAIIVQLTELPLLPNGKVDRQALRALAPDRSESKEGSVAPRTTLEETVARAWTDVLHIDRLGVHDNFFDVGGHSLIATQVVSRIRDACRVELPLRTFFEHPTVAGLADWIESARSDGSGASTGSPVLRVSRDGDLPLSFSQQRLWFLHQLDPKSPAYNISGSVRLRGRLDVSAVVESLSHIVRRHEALRTTFPSVDGEPRQKIAAEPDFRMSLLDLTAWPEADRDSESARLAVEQTQQPFDLACGPLVRCILVRLARSEHVLVVTMHHIVSDGWSAGVFVREFVALYEAFSRAAPSPLSELPVQYADFSVWQREQLAGEALSSDIAYWRKQLAGVPVLTLPTDRPRPPVRTFAGADCTVEIGEELRSQLSALAGREDCTLFMVLLAAIQTLTAKYTGQEDIAVGSPIANRNRTEIEGLIGFFVNSLVMRADLSGDPSFVELLRQVRETTLGAYAHQDVPFERLVDALGVARDASQNPLFQVVFAWQNVPFSAMQLPDLVIDVDAFDRGTARFDLEFHLWEHESGLRGRICYNTDLFDAATIEGMRGHLQKLLQQIAADPRRRLSELPLLTEVERQVFVEWNDTRRKYPRQECVHRLFEEQVRRTPDATAVVFGDEQVSYAELNVRSNRLAHYLARLGVGRGTRVGLCVERSIEMVTAMLGILKAGGAYVPLDPTYPAERLVFMLEDSGAPVLLTQRCLRARFPHVAASATVCLDEGWESTAPEDGENPTTTATADDLAYVIYTSGSTGKPKGVCVPHRGIMRLVIHTDYVQLESTDRIAQASNASFDAATFEIWGALLHGACLVGTTKEVLLSPEAFAEHIDQSGISVLFITTALFNQIAREAPGVLSPLRYVLFGGEAVDPAWVRAVLQAGPPQHLLHVYGPTENTTFSTWYEVREVSSEATTVPIGRPIANTTAYVLDRYQNPVPVGVPGELYLGGDGLAVGYLDRPELTAERFVPDRFSGETGAKLYKTGDLVRFLPNGNIEFLGRNDDQVKIRGFRIELGEVETALRRHPAVRQAVVVAREDQPGDKRLVAYVVSDGPPDAADWRSFVSARLPDYMVPSIFVPLDRLPLAANGKLNREALPAPAGDRPLGATFLAPRSEMEKTIAAIWADVLGVDQVGVRDNFFDLGGHSLLLTRVHSRLCKVLNRDMSIVDLFQFPSVSALARHLDESKEGGVPFGETRDAVKRSDPTANAERGIAIIGMSGRFPGASNVDAFWRNLVDGTESVSFFSDQELVAAGADPRWLKEPNYVKAGAVLSNIDQFDASFFGYTPREAEVMDPQHRLFLECAWEALESAGYNPTSNESAIGVYAGASSTTYGSRAMPGPEETDGADPVQTIIGAGRDFLTTRVSYKLNLRGPSVNVQTACSTSLVAVHMACRGILDRECDMALAGGAAISVPQGCGYFHQAGSIASPDGHCRAFDAKAEGMLRGNGVGIVVLKRLSDAVRDRDHIYAVIKGSAINNDGADKVGYTAPSVNGQAEVVTQAQEAAGVDPETIEYIEAHGTGTALGDPIEIAALTQAFRRRTGKSRFCAIGSLKTNIGHLDTAAGVAGLIKTALALKQGVIPPSLHYQAPNPKIDFERSPFYVNACRTEWKSGNGPRRAGVSSFGIGGTNAHVVLEEAPADLPSATSRPQQILVLSAKTTDALEVATAQLSEHFKVTEDLSLADAAFTLQTGRRAFDHRRVVICRDVHGAVEALGSLDPQRVRTAAVEMSDRPVAFLFPGQGAQYVNMGRELFDTEPRFRDEVNVCCELLRPHLGIDLREVLYPREAESEDAERRLNETLLAQPALFVIEYALAQLWMAWGIQPRAMIGHSIGEYVAACLSGVFTLADALGLVATRARLMQELPAGAMLSVPLPRHEVKTHLQGGVSLAAVNGPSLCVVSGPTTEVEQLERRLADRGLVCRRLHTSHAFHSGMVDPVVEAFAAAVSAVERRAPRLAYVSNLTGTWVTAAEATDATYWAKHLRNTVQFSEGLGTLSNIPNCVLLEVGPGTTLASLARQHSDADGRLIVSSARHPADRKSDVATLLRTVGELWLAGAPVDWREFQAGWGRRRVPLPTYPFERRRYWIELEKTNGRQTPLRKEKDVADWLYLPSWKRTMPPGKELDDSSCWCVFLDECGLGVRLMMRLKQKGFPTVGVRVGEQFGEDGDGVYRVRPDRREDYERLFTELGKRGAPPTRIAHLWGVTQDGSMRTDPAYAEQCQSRGFYSLLYLAQMLGRDETADGLRRHLTVVTNNAQDVTGVERIQPEKAAALGLCKVMPLEYQSLTCRCVDVVVPEHGMFDEPAAALPLTELLCETSDPVAAVRGAHRLVPAFEPVGRNGAADAGRLRMRGVYLITGGLGGVGLELAEYLARTVQAKLVLVSRSGLPEEAEWGWCLEEHGGKSPVCQRIRRVQSLQALGAEVIAVRADVTERDQMEAVVRRTIDRFGALHGVIHAAGGEKTLKLIEEAERSVCEEQFATKMRGLYVLEEVLADVPPDFCLLYSSLASVMGVAGQGAYTAAHAYMDAFACRCNRTSRFPWIAVNSDNWTTWRASGVPDAAADTVMTREEGWEAFARVLSLGPTRLLVSTSDLAARVDHWQGRQFRRKQQRAEECRTDARGRKPIVATGRWGPTTDAERVLTEIWQGLLGIGHIGVRDNFFELGGDSVIGIQVVARAKRAGLRLTPRHLFEHQTIAELAAAAEDVGSIGAEDEPITSTSPLAPIQHWFFERDWVNIHHFNHAMLLTVPAGLPAERWEQVAARLVAHHDALRLRFVRDDGRWRQEIGASDQASSFSQIDLASVADGELSAAIERAATNLQSSLNLTNGPIVRFVNFDCGPHRPGRLFIIVHHLAIDAISWGILLEDLRALCDPANGASSELSLPPKTTSFPTWSRRLREHTVSGGFREECDYWLGLPWDAVDAVPRDEPAGENTTATEQTVSTSLSPEETRVLLREAPDAYHARLPELLLAAFGAAYSEWTGFDGLLLDYEGHGREEILPGVDVSRTVGWFTAVYPILLTGLAAPDHVARIRCVKEQFRSIPHGGIGYGALRYLSDEAAVTEALVRLPRPEVSFLYFGRLGHMSADGSPIRRASESVGPLCSPGAKRPHLLAISSHVADGRFQVRFGYSDRIHRKTTIDALAKRFADGLRSIIDHCSGRDVAAYSPSDFPHADLSQEELANLIARFDRMEARG